MCVCLPVFSCSIARPFYKVQFCLLCQWNYFFFSFFSLSFLYSAGSSPEGMTSDLSCPLFIASEKPFFFFFLLLVLSYSKCTPGGASPWLTVLHFVLGMCGYSYPYVRGYSIRTCSLKKLVKLNFCLRFSSCVTFLSDLYCSLQLHLLEFMWRRYEVIVHTKVSLVKFP